MYKRQVKDSYNVNWFSQKAAMAALRDLHYMRNNVERIKQTRKEFSQAMSKLGYEVLPSEANFVMVRKPGENLESEYLYLKKNHILVRYFTEWPDSMRISIGKMCIRDRYKKPFIEGEFVYNRV